MKRRSKLTLAAIAVVIIAIGVGAALFQPRPSGTENNTMANTTIASDNSTAPRITLNIISTGSAFPFVQRWAAQYNNDQTEASLQVSYREGEETAGDMAIVGSADNNNRSYVPVSAQAVAVVYNIPSVPDIPPGMNLNASLLSSILNGTVTQWNDPAIKVLNHNLNLPSERIIVVHQNGNSSSLGIIGRYVSSPIKWPNNSIGVLGPDELAATVRKTPYSIGYVDFSYAMQTRMTFAALANAQGEYVLPSIDSIRQAVNSSLQVRNITSLNLTSGLTPPLMNASALSNGSYPLTGLYYASIPSQIPNATRNATIDFVMWIIDIDKGQKTLSELEYPALYGYNELLTTYSQAVMNNTVPR